MLFAKGANVTSTNSRVRTRALGMPMHTDPSRTTPIGLSRYAREFFDCALAADNVVGMRHGNEIIAPIPVLYLVGHSIELSLKSYLMFHGVPLRELPTKKYGHDLMKSLKKAKELGLGSLVTLDGGELEALEVLNDLYSSKQLNYIVTGSKRYPSFGPIHTACEKLLASIGPKVGYK